MAKPKLEPSDAMKNARAAREVYDKAVEAHKAKPNTENEKRLKDAKANLAAAKTLESRDRFQRVGNSRMAAAETAIVTVGKMANPASYSYDETDIAKIESILTNAVTNAVKELRAAKSKTGGAGKGAANSYF